jgi:glycosyltransferase involved in cell wall biosynthesis
MSKSKVVVVLPAYNAAATLKQTLSEVPKDLVDDIILCDDASKDNTVHVAKNLQIAHIIVHDENKGYGANQKSLYTKALSLDADIIIMLHPDYQYTPLLIPSMINLIQEDLYDVVLGSRILGKGALEGGMPIYKYIANRLLTFIQNLLVGHKLSEYHTGYRVFRKEVFMKIPFELNSDDFIFDNQLLSQIIYHEFRIGEISCPTKYFPEASSINLRRSAVYGIGVLFVSLKHFLQRTGLIKFAVYNRK